MTESITKSMLTAGMEVEVNPRSDRSRNQIVKGTISEILTSKESHPHGILVRLADGTEGRVKKISPLGKMPPLGMQGPKEKLEASHAPSLVEIIQCDEDSLVEYKTSVLWSKFKTKEEIRKSNSAELNKYGQKASKFIIAKSIAGFLNSSGGILVIGVAEEKDSDEKRVLGIDLDYEIMKNKSQDVYRRMILDEVIQPFLPPQIFNHFDSYMRFQFEIVEGKTVLGIFVKPSELRVFVKTPNESIFFVRIDASTRQLSGPDLVDYCAKRFK